MDRKRSLILGISVPILVILSGNIIIYILTYQEPLEDFGPTSDFQLTNEKYENVSLASYGNMVILIDFIYVRCPMANMCPLSTFKMSQVQDNLLARGYTTEDFQLLSISFDWINDEPENLTEYGNSYNANFTVWSFLSGTQEQVENVVAAYNIFSEFNNETGFFGHTMILTLVDRFGHIRATYHSSQTRSWTVDIVTSHVIQLINENDNK